MLEILNQLSNCQFLVNFFGFAHIYGAGNVDEFKSVSSYCERSMRRNAQNSVDFARINAELLKQLDAKIIAIDATTIKKSGEHTFGLGKFWSSCDGKVVQSIEYSCVDLIDPNSLSFFGKPNTSEGNRIDF